MSARSGNPLGSHLGRILAVCALTVLVYSNTSSAPFVFDDIANIQAQPSIRVEGLDFDALRQAAFGGRMRTRPVANLSFALNYYFGEYRVAGYHLVNLVVHLCNAVLVYWLALALFAQQEELAGGGGMSPPPSSAAFSAAPSLVSSAASVPSRSVVPSMALLAATVFAVHPLQTQTVTYTVQRMNALATMFLLSAFLCYLGARRAPRRAARASLYGGSLIGWGLALGCKEIAAILPLLLWLYEWYFPGRLERVWLRRNLGYLVAAGAFVVALAALYVGGNPLRAIAADYATRDFTLAQRLLTEPRVLLFYLSLVVLPLPSRLNLMHDFTASGNLLEPATTLPSLLGLLALFAVAVAVARRQRLTSFCILWFLATLVIESSVVGLELAFEHRLYLPMVAVALLASQALFRLTRRRPAVRLVVATSVVALLAAGTYARNRVWRDEITLWSDVVAKNPRAWRGHNNLGVALAAAGRLDEAVGQYREAIGGDPGSVPARVNLARILRSRGRLAGAARLGRQALRADPDAADVRMELALTLAAQKRFVRAARLAVEAVSRRPHDAVLRTDCGRVLAAGGRLDEAAEQFAAALDLEPELAEAHANLGRLRRLQGRFAEAVEHFEAALRVRPDDERARRDLEASLLALRARSRPGSPALP